MTCNHCRQCNRLKNPPTKKEILIDKIEFSIVLTVIIISLLVIISLPFLLHFGVL